MTPFTTGSIAPALQDPSAPRRLMHRIGAYLIERRSRRAQSSALRQLKARDLQDIGLVDRDLAAANNLPLGADAAAALHRASLGRRGNTRAIQTPVRR